MTQDEIREMAKEADAYADAMDIGGQNYIGLRDKHFAKLVAETQREKSANLLLELDLCGQEMKAANAIRARGHI